MKADLILKNGSKLTTWVSVDVLIVNSDLVKFETENFDIQAKQINGAIEAGADMYQFSDRVQIIIKREKIEYIKFVE